MLSHITRDNLPANVISTKSRLAQSASVIKGFRKLGYSYSEIRDMVKADPFKLLNEFEAAPKPPPMRMPRETIPSRSWGQRQKENAAKRKREQEGPPAAPKPRAARKKPKPSVKISAPSPNETYRAALPAKMAQEDAAKWKALGQKARHAIYAEYDNSGLTGSQIAYAIGLKTGCKITRNMVCKYFNTNGFRLSKLAGGEIELRAKRSKG